MISVPLRESLRRWLIAEADLRLRQLANREAKVRPLVAYDITGHVARKLAELRDVR